jgi:uncharacterized protein
MFDHIYTLRQNNGYKLINLYTLKTLQVSDEEINKIKDNVHNDIIRNFLNETEIIYEYSSIKSQELSLNLQIVLSYKCNYRCTYCYEGGYKNANIKFRGEYLKNIDEFYTIYCKHYGINKNYKTISLMGGEPLLPENYKTIESIFSYWKDCNFIITTNGTYIEYYKTLLKKYPVELHVSLDGIKEIHYRYRRSNDLSAYDQTLCGIRWLASEGISTVVMSVFHPEFVDKYPSFFDLMEELGWLKTENLGLFFNIEVGDGSDDIDFDYLIKTNEAFKQLKSMDVRTSKVQSKKIVPGSSRLITGAGDISAFKFPNTYKCSCLISPSYNFLPDGSVSLCNMFRPGEGIVGLYAPNVRVDFDKIELLKQRNVLRIDKCLKCKYKFLCGGGCPVSAFRKTGSYMEPNCGIWEKNYDILSYFENVL